MSVVTPLADALRVSFEFFPPKTRETEVDLWHAVERLAPLDPDFVSVTYGAGGSTRDRTLGLVARMARRTSLRAAGHLTCVGASRDEVDDVARAYRDAGVTRIVALRGDTPDGGKFVPHPEGYSCAAELVEGLMKVHDFDISVAAYPEVHPDAASADADLDNLKRKIDAGARRAITQFFFEAETYLRFVERARKAGITAPIVPGILPVVNFKTARKFAEACGTHVPKWMERAFEGLDDDPNTRQLIAASLAVELCLDLKAQGVRDFHFYTLNKADLTYAICHMLGARPPGERTRSRRMPAEGAADGEATLQIASENKTSW